MDEATEGLNAINNWAVQFNSSSSNIATYVISAMLSVALIFVVWAVANKKPNANTYVIAWLTALIFAILFIL